MAEDPLLKKAQEIAQLPKSQQPSIALALEQQADTEHIARVEQKKVEAAAAAEAEEAAKAARIEAVKVIGESKDALIARLKERHADRFAHTLEVEAQSGDLILHSEVKLDSSEHPRRVSTSRRIPKAEHEKMSREDVAAFEHEQLHVLAHRLGV